MFWINIACSVCALCIHMYLSYNSKCCKRDILWILWGTSLHAFWLFSMHKIASWEYHISENLPWERNLNLFSLGAVECSTFTFTLDNFFFSFWMPNINIHSCSSDIKCPACPGCRQRQQRAQLCQAPPDSHSTSPCSNSPGEQCATQGDTAGLHAGSLRIWRQPTGRQYGG